MRIDLNELNIEIEAGNVRRQIHPSLPLAIYKYSQQCVFSRHWNDITLLCRGIVLDEVGNVVVNSFSKFFNHSEQDGQSIYESGKSQNYVVTEKLDGSLIQVAKYNGQLVVTSSGSFTSPQAMKATELINASEDYINLFEDNKTYLFELIYPENRIVINYGDKVSLTLLAIRNTETGDEFPLDVNVNSVKTVNMTLDEIESDLNKSEFINKEGYIVRFSDGSRVKMKYDEYMRLHKIVSGVNEKYIWEALRDGVDLEASLIGIPDELFDFVKKTIVALKSEFSKKELLARGIYEDIKRLPSRKEQAMCLIKNHKELSALVFCMLDGSDYSSKIWKIIEPETSTRFGMGESNP